MTPFEQAFSATMRNEGGYTESGPTYRGIDRRWWPEWSGWLIVDDWRSGIVTSEQRDEALAGPVMDFYRQNFWHLVRGDELAALDLPLAMAMFDMAVNSGPHDATRALQRALNRLNRSEQVYRDIAVDGRLGPQTIQTLRRQLQTTYGGSVETARRLIRTCFAGERYIHFVACPDHESWPGWFLRLSWG